MTRSASPNGAVEFSYDFPVAGPSHLRVPTTPTRAQRTRSPARFEHTSYRADDDDEFDEEVDYDAFGYPRTHRAFTHPAPTPTRNQWRAPSPPLYPYADSYPYSSSYTNAYASPLPIILTPSGTGSSCDSDASALSSCARSCRSQRSHKEKPHREHAKIRKPRRSVDEDAPRASSPVSSPHSSPYFQSSFDDSFPDSSSSDEEEERDFDIEQEEDEEDKDNLPSPSSSAPGPHSLRMQWEALSLRVRFGVFRAKRKMKARVMSL